MSRSDRLVVIQPPRLKELIREEVTAAVDELVEARSTDLRALKGELPLSKAVLTHKEVAADYLSGEVTPETVIRYIKEEGLSATKKGRA